MTEEELEKEFQHIKDDIYTAKGTLEALLKGAPNYSRNRQAAR